MILKFLRRILKPKKQQIVPLDHLQYNLIWRENLLIRLQHLDAPEPIIHKQKELIRKAELAVNERMAGIKNRAIRDRVAMDNMGMEEVHGI